MSLLKCMRTSDYNIFKYMLMDKKCVETNRGQFSIPMDL